MINWKRLFRVNDRKSAEKSLPRITSSEVHRTFGPSQPPPIPSPGGRQLEQAVGLWNDRDYDRALPLFDAAVSAGHRSLAHSLLGEIYIYKKELFLAVNQLLHCLRCPDRSEDMLWEATTRLGYIYDAAGREKEAQLVKDLAQYINRKKGGL